MVWPTLQASVTVVTRSCDGACNLNVTDPFRWIRVVLLACAIGAGKGRPVSAAVLWSDPGWHDLHQTNRTLSLEGSALRPKGDSSGETLYLRFTVDPLSDGVSEMIEHYLAGWVFAEKGIENLGLGNALNAWGYSAFNAAQTGPPNEVEGEFDFLSLHSEILGDSEFDSPRIGTPRTIAARIDFIPGDIDRITVWMQPDLSAGSKESRMLPKQTTTFRANASFDEIRLRHRGGGRGWRIGSLMVATTFEDLTEPHPWQKPSFTLGWVAAILVLGGFGWWRTSRRERLLTRQRDELESSNSLERERARIARDLHDSLGAALSEISLTSSIAQTNGAPLQALRRIERLARNSVEELETIVWATDPKADTVQGFADHATRFATDFLSAAGIRTAVSMPPGRLTESMQSGVRHQAFLAFKEAIHNVVKHARAGEVRIGIENHPHRLSVTIADDGIGICPDTDARERNGDQRHGLQSIRSRLESIGGAASIESHTDRGTKVRFEIPL